MSSEQNRVDICATARFRIRTSLQGRSARSFPLAPPFPAFPDDPTFGSMPGAVDPASAHGDALSAKLEALIARYAAKVRWVARDCRLDSDDVDDLIQDVRIRLWRVIERGERNAAEKPSYIHRTVMSAAVDLIRRRRGNEEGAAPTVRQAAVESAAPAGQRPDRAAESSDVVDRINGAINELSDARRPLVRMYLAGYQIEEMARRLGWTEPKTRNLLYRGLAELRQRLVLLGVASLDER